MDCKILVEGKARTDIKADKVRILICIGISGKDKNDVVNHCNEAFQAIKELLAKNNAKLRDTRINQITDANTVKRLFNIGQADASKTYFRISMDAEADVDLGLDHLIRKELTSISSTNIKIKLSTSVSTNPLWSDKLIEDTKKRLIPLAYADAYNKAICCSSKNLEELNIAAPFDDIIAEEINIEKVSVPSNRGIMREASIGYSMASIDELYTEENQLSLDDNYREMGISLTVVFRGCKA